MVDRRFVGAVLTAVLAVGAGVVGPASVAPETHAAEATSQFANHCEGAEVSRCIWMANSSTGFRGGARIEDRQNDGVDYEVWVTKLQVYRWRPTMERWDMVASSADTDGRHDVYDTALTPFWNDCPWGTKQILETMANVSWARGATVYTDIISTEPYTVYC
jgi:hypothetical protein